MLESEYDKTLLWSFIDIHFHYFTVFTEGYDGHNIANTAVFFNYSLPYFFNYLS